MNQFPLVITQTFSTAALDTRQTALQQKTVHYLKAQAQAAAGQHKSTPMPCKEV